MCSYIVALEKRNKKNKILSLRFFSQVFEHVQSAMFTGFKNITHCEKHKMPVKNPEKVYFTSFST